MSPPTSLYHHCARLLRAAPRLLITAGAGMGVDAGLPDFRGTAGLWRAYPALRQPGLSFHDIANPAAFHRWPRLAWGFYGHRLALYRQTPPHPGYALLRDLAEAPGHSSFVVTSNVDGHFRGAGYAATTLYEIHGSIHHWQCLTPCSDQLWPASSQTPVIDDRSCHWLGELPTCPRCGDLARPNILMFNDAGWIEHRSAQQGHRFAEWLASGPAPLVLELGAGTAINTLRQMGDRQGNPLLRINPREAEVHRSDHISVPATALEALTRLHAAWRATEP